MFKGQIKSVNHQLHAARQQTEAVSRQLQTARQQQSDSAARAEAAVQEAQEARERQAEADAQAKAAAAAAEAGGQQLQLGPAQASSAQQAGEGGAVPITGGTLHMSLLQSRDHAAWAHVVRLAACNACELGGWPCRADPLLTSLAIMLQALTSSAWWILSLPAAKSQTLPQPLPTQEPSLSRNYSASCNASSLSMPSWPTATRRSVGTRVTCRTS